MAIFRIFESCIYPLYQELIDFNRQARDNPENEGIKAALNLNLILCSACLVEGMLEDRGKLLLGYFREVFNQINVPDFQLRKPINHFYNNIESFLHKRVSQSTGLDNYSALFETFTGSSLKKHTQISPLYEGVSVLFQLRNVIAHGRQVHAYEVEAYYTNGVEEYFNGGYKKAEDYLMKKGLLSERFLETECGEMYFTDEIADHFCEIAQNFIRQLDTYIFDNIEIGELLQNRLRKYNENYGENYDMLSYLRMRGARE